jgi:hypothetical protein
MQRSFQLLSLSLSLINLLLGTKNINNVDLLVFFIQNIDHDFRQFSMTDLNTICIMMHECSIMLWDLLHKDKHIIQHSILSQLLMLSDF